MIPISIQQGNILMNDNTIITNSDLNLHIKKAKLNINKVMNNYSYTTDGSKIKQNYQYSTPVSVDSNNNVIMSDGSLISKLFMSTLHSMGKPRTNNNVSNYINRSNESYKLYKHENYDRPIKKMYKHENYNNYASLTSPSSYNSLPGRKNMSGPAEHYNNNNISPFHSAYGEKHFTVNSAYGK